MKNCDWNYEEHIHSLEKELAKLQMENQEFRKELRSLTEKFFERMRKLHPENQMERAEQAANFSIELMAEVWRFCNSFSMTDEEIEESFNNYLKSRFKLSNPNEKQNP